MIHWQVRVVCLYTAPSQLNLEILLDVPCQCISIAVPTYTGSSTYLGTATTVLLRVRVSKAQSYPHFRPHWLDPLAPGVVPPLHKLP